MVKKIRVFAGDRIRNLRTERGLKQAEMSTILGISVSYLSQIEHDDRPLTPAIMAQLSRNFPIDWDFSTEDAMATRAAALQEVVKDPIFKTEIPVKQLGRIAEQQPDFADQFIDLHAAYRLAGEKLQILDEAISNEGDKGSRLPWEEVRDWFHHEGNYVDIIDRAAEDLAIHLRGDQDYPKILDLKGHLTEEFGVSVVERLTDGLREYDTASKTLMINPGEPNESKVFQIAHQLAALAFHMEIKVVVDRSKLRTTAAVQLLTVGLANYAAGALLMPYGKFRKEARRLRHDIDELRQSFGVSFEQACHRLSTLQRPGANGIPFFFCRVDMAGNITKRHSATRLQFARFGGACPLWVAHEAVAIPDRILVQLAETPDQVRYVSMAKGLVKPSGSYARVPRRYAVALGCEVDHADEFIYADGLDLDSEQASTKIGVSCRLCPRKDCDQRAFPPSDKKILFDPDKRSIVPYDFN